jgi:hypothetical protein
MITDPTQFGIALSFGAFAGMVACAEIGYRLGRRRSAETAYQGIGAIQAAVFALLVLLLAFSFSGGTTHLESRRQLIIEEANAIRTAYLRLDMLDAAEQPEMRRLFREYVDARIQIYEKLPNTKAAEQEMERADGLQRQLWSGAIKASQTATTPAVAMLLLPAVNHMIDVTTSRRIAIYTHLPWLIVAVLTIAALVSGLLAGFDMSQRRSRSWLHMTAYAFIISLTIYAVIDLDYPRSGLIRLDAADSALAQLRDSFR